MATTLTNNQNGTSTLAISYTGPTAKLNAVLEDAAHYAFDHGYAAFGGPGTWADQTMANKRAIVDAAVKQELIDKARAHHVNTSIEAEREAANAEASTNYGI